MLLTNCYLQQLYYELLQFIPAALSIIINKLIVLIIFFLSLNSATLFKRNVSLSPLSTHHNEYYTVVTIQ